MRGKTLLAIVSGTVLIAMPTRAALVLDYAFGSSAQAGPSLEASGITAGQFTAHGSLVGAGSGWDSTHGIPAGSFTSVGWPTSQNSANFVSFSFNVDATHELDLSNLSWVNLPTASLTAHSPLALGVFAKVGTDPTISLGTVIIGPANSWNAESISLSSFTGLQNIEGKTVTFAFFGGASTSATLPIRFDNVEVRGTLTAVPEPSTILAGMLLLLPLGLSSFRILRKAQTV
jgi:hypothetical protein